MARATRRIALAGAALSALAGAACLSVAPFTVAPAGAQTAPPTAPVTIGVLTDMSGQFSHEAGEGSVTAVRMAIEDFGGRVLGQPIELLVSDHQNKNDVALARAREWYDVGGVDLITNLINSGIALGVANVAKEKNRIAIVNGSGSSRLTNDACTPNTIHYAYDTYALAKGTGSALAKAGGTSWFFLTADYAFGHALEADTAAVVKSLGGAVVGSVRYPINSMDQSSFLLQAQQSGAKVVGLAGSGTVFVNAVKAAREFGVRENGQMLAGLLVWITDIKELGLAAAQGLVLTNAFYWDRDDETRAFAKRFSQRMGRPPHMGDAGDYSSTLHYLKAVQAAGTKEPGAVLARMRAMPVDDVFAHGGQIRADGRMVHDMYVYEVKTPAESKGEWDYYKLRAVIPKEEAFRPLSESACPLVKKG